MLIYEYRYPPFINDHHSVMDIRDWKYKYLTAVMCIYHSITTVHNSKLWYPQLNYGYP